MTAVAKFLKHGVSVLLAAGVLGFVGLVGPVLQGRLFPVVTDTFLTKTEQRGPRNTQIWGSSDKHRTCAFRRIEWFYGNPDTNKGSQVHVEILEASKIREEGKFYFGPWDIHMSEALLKENSTATVYHSCAWLPWLPALWEVPTKFYP